LLSLLRHDSAAPSLCRFAGLHQGQPLKEKRKNAEWNPTLRKSGEGWGPPTVLSVEEKTGKCEPPAPSILMAIVQVHCRLLR
jgi:hypothetical protein